MAATTFNFDEKTGQVLADLQERLGASSQAEVLKRAVALLDIAADYKDAQGSITIQKDEDDKKIVIQLTE